MANENVLIGCKLPHGIVLQVGDTSVKLAGNSFYSIPEPTRKHNPKPELFGADSLTLVPREFWEAWLSTHMDYAPVKSGAIYAATTKDAFKAKSREMETVKSGFDRFDPPDKASGGRPLDR